MYGTLDRWTRWFGPLCTFGYKLFRPRVVWVLTSVGLSCLWLRSRRPRLKLKDPEDAEDPRVVNHDHQEAEPAAEDPRCDDAESLEPSNTPPPQRSTPDREPDDDDEAGDDEEEESDHYAVEPADPLYCEYDSTWDTPSGSPRVRPRRESTQRLSDYKFNRFENAARDMYNYRHDYPLSTGSRFQSSKPGNNMPNLNFYLGKMPSVPDGVYIHGFHEDWWGDYSKLERVHTFIQWLFPLQETGMNHEAYELTKQEIEAFCNDGTAKRNLQQSYRLMLDFYGIELSNPETGEVRRAENWQKRFQNLNRNTHNNLRITRILKCLGTLGFGHYQAPLVRFFLEETLMHGNLATVKDSVLNYFLFAVLDKVQRRKLVHFAYLNYDPKEEFIWCPKKIQRRFSSQMKATSGLSNPADPSPEEPLQV